MGIFDIFKKKNTNSGPIDIEPIDVNYVGATIQPGEPVNNRSFLQAEDCEFYFEIEDVFTITGRGTVVAGCVGKGKIGVNEEVTLHFTSDGREKKVKIVGIEAFRKILPEANCGENVGLLISNVVRKEVNRGDILYR